LGRSRQRTPEIFRVSDEAKYQLSLVARYVQPSDPTKKRPPLSPEFTQTLINTAIELYDRQKDAAARRKHFVPLWTALITGVLVIASSLLTLKVGPTPLLPGVSSAQVILFRTPFCWIP